MTAVRTPSGLKEIGAVFLRTPGGLKGIGEIWLRTAGGLKQVFGALSASASPDSASGATYSHSFQRVTTNSVTITVMPPGAASISWTFDDAGWNVSSPGSFTTAFVSPSIGPGGGVSTTAHGTVTRGSSTAVVDIGLSADNFGT